ncbi:MAG: hypothetical protein U1C96_12670 [Gallionella sp.]|nr:hypothetical protein [Gallionella sp.]
MPDRFVTVLIYPLHRLRRAGAGLWQLQNRERLRIRDEMSATQRLVPLVMKQRNGEHWTVEDRREIREHLHRMAALSPYMVLFVMPGGLFMLPVLAWWLDRRRLSRQNRDGHSS